MELYEEYIRIKRKYKDASKTYDKVLERKARLYFDMEPKAVDVSKERVNGGKREDQFASFVANLEEIDIELHKARNERDLQNYFLKKKELELRESQEVINKIYAYRYIDRMKVKHIALKVHYGKTKIYEYINEIEEKIEEMRSAEKNGKNLC